MNKLHSYPNQNLAFKLNESGVKAGIADDLEKAVSCFKQAIDQDANYWFSYSNLGTAYQKLGKLNLAKNAYLHSLKLNPNQSNDHYHLGIVYNQLGQSKSAIKHYLLQLKQNPDHFESLNNLANIYVNQNKRSQAKPLFEQILNTDSAHPQALPNYVWLLQWICDWDSFEKYTPILDSLTTTQLSQNQTVSEEPLANITRCTDPKRNLDIATSKSQAITSSVSNSPNFSYHSSLHHKIRLGYLSADFRDHAVAHLTKQLFLLHDRTQFQVHTFSYGPDDHSEYHKFIQTHSDSFTDLQQLTDFQAAKLISQSQIDILIDLTGHTGNHRLKICAHRSAPIQITWLGFPGSSGADFFDYIILDKTIAPPAHAKKYYSETPIYMPHTYQITDSSQQVAKQLSKKTLGLPADKFIFASFSQTYKINKKIFTTWMQILQATSNSILVLFIRDSLASTYIKHHTQKLGVSPDRIVFVDNLPKDQHLARLKLCDLILDTPIMNGHTTTSDALFVGTPVITVQGSHFASRVASSLLRAIGMPQLITTSYDSYKNLAINLAANPQKLHQLRQQIMTNKKTYPLFNTKQFVKHLEQAYQQVWDNSASRQTKPIYL